MAGRRKKDRKNGLKARGEKWGQEGNTKSKRKRGKGLENKCPKVAEREGEGVGREFHAFREQIKTSVAPLGFSTVMLTAVSIFWIQPF
ncbi:hypothetical protein LSTR_LSTR016149 [Laodelphax striatellus]|uniref:Uncharacterized protein n=1 Tax=Laodelphax striatellus TaxID=195883 RepID=A0A482X0G8_LAOST|nr:hypothetical protein LSTR_LSTR009473 [Laodelphax striatellus]RZF42542.1 hypothetical protein LSTR_LSTR016149 [Laodelphax striatellus]